MVLKYTTQICVADTTALRTHSFHSYKIGFCVKQSILGMCGHIVMPFLMNNVFFLYVSCSPREAAPLRTLQIFGSFGDLKRQNGIHVSSSQMLPFFVSYIAHMLYII